MAFCSVSKCGNSRLTKGVTFHSFPKDPALKARWVSATGKKNWSPTDESRICSVHFNEWDFNPTKRKPLLFKDSVPTQKIWIIVDDSSTDNAEKPNASFGTFVYRNHVCDEDLDLRGIRKMRREIVSQQRKIRALKLEIKDLMSISLWYSKKIIKMRQAMQEYQNAKKVMIQKRRVA